MVGSEEGMKMNDDDLCGARWGVPGAGLRTLALATLGLVFSMVAARAAAGPVAAGKDESLEARFDAAAPFSGGVLLVDDVADEVGGGGG